MTQQWFLDLDGAKSGPYQTPEILNLIAEGEILPHHRIATSLKDGVWVSVLNWRLEQSKLTPSKAAPELQPTKEKSSQPSPPPSQSAPTVPPLKVSEPVQAASFQGNAAPTHPPTPPHIQIGAQDSAMAQASSRRDPMAEMFDMLQKTKQKREEKQIQTAVAQNTASVATHIAKSKSESSGRWKTVAMAVGITFVGFWLGQWFQKSAPPNPPPVVQSAPSKEPAPVSAAAPVTAPAHTEEPMDRSTDKIVIRTHGQTKQIQTAPVQANADVVQPKDAKDLKELQDLKTELLEIKKLKDQLKNSMNDDGGDFQQIDEGPGGDQGDPRGTAGGNTQNGAQPLQNPRNVGNPDLHY